MRPVLTFSICYDISLLSKELPVFIIFVYFDYGLDIIVIPSKSSPKPISAANCNRLFIPAGNPAVAAHGRTTAVQKLLNLLRRL